MDSINTIYETLLSCFVDNHEDLGELLVDKNGENLSEVIRNKLSEIPNILDQAIFSVIEYMAAYSPSKASGVPSFSNSTEDINYYDEVIMELTIKNLELPKKTLANKNAIMDAFYRRYQIKVIKNMARITSDNTKKIKSHGEFIVEQALYNQDKSLTCVKRILILKDLDKLNIDIGNKIKSKQIESARIETENFLVSQGIKK